jgi:hypothetical protein
MISQFDTLSFFLALMIDRCLTLSNIRFGLCPSGTCCARGTEAAETLSSFADTSDCGSGAPGDFDISTILQAGRQSNIADR